MTSRHRQSIGHRRWIGIDITHLAVKLMKHRLQNTFGVEVREEYEVIGEPTDLAGPTPASTGGSTSPNPPAAHRRARSPSR